MSDNQEKPFRSFSVRLTKEKAVALQIYCLTNDVTAKDIMEKYFDYVLAGGKLIGFDQK